MDSSGISVLIVDDEAAIRESLQDFLEDYEYRVTAVGSSEEALDVLAGAHFDIVIVDLRLPGISGETMVLKAHKAYPDLKYLVHTGSVDYQLSAELRAIGIKPEHMLLKPITDMTSIVTLISKLVNPGG
jgi:CheY-like chemotaxis protein